MSYVQLSEGGFQVVYPLGLWSRFSAPVCRGAVADARLGLA